MTRKLTGQLLGFFPVGVLGGLPQKAGWECLYKAQVVVENAQMTNNQLCGLTTDVVKMFNAVRGRLRPLYLKKQECQQQLPDPGLLT